MHSFSDDLRYACRMLRRTPVFTVVTIVTLALGIGANTAIFSVMDALMIRNLPVRDPDRLVELFSRYPGEPRRNGFGWTFYEYFRDHNQVFTDLIAISPAQFEVRTGARDPEPAIGEYVSGNFFTALGVPAALGRVIDPEDDGPGRPSTVAVISWTYWQRRFSGNASLVGTDIVVNGRPVTVIGVTSPAFFGVRVGIRPDVWIPVALAEKPPFVGLLGRLKPGVSLERALADMRVLDQWRVAEMSRNSADPQMRQLQIAIEPAASGASQLRDQFSNQVVTLMALVGLMLLMACTTLASMLLARGAARRAELSIRVALGATRLRIVRQVVTESAVLVTMGALLGIGLASLGAHALVRSWRPDVRGWGPQPVDMQVGLDGRVLLFTAIVAILTGVLFGLPAARRAASSAPASALRGVHGHARTGLRRVFGQSFVVAQVAISLVLATAAALFVGHLSDLRSVERLGFRRESVLLVTLDLRNSKYPREQLLNLYRDLLARFERIPGVRSSTLSAITPIEGPGWSRFAHVPGFEERPEDRRYAALNAVAPNYFQTLGTPLLSGRDFRYDDVRGPRVAIINQAFARYYFGDSNPLGRHLTFDRETTPYEIVGVAADAKYSELHEPVPRSVYLNAFQENRVRLSQFALRTSVTPAALVNDVRRAVDDVMKTVPIAKVTTLADQVDAAMAPERTIARLSGLFGAVGVCLAAIGLYGLLSYTVSQRVNEIGIRMALGATSRSVTRLVLNATLRLVFAGLVVGAPIAIASRPLAARLVVNMTTPVVVPMAVAAGMMVAVSLLAAYLPARRAARVDPLEALRHE